MRVSREISLGSSLHRASTNALILPTLLLLDSGQTVFCTDSTLYSMCSDFNLLKHGFCWSKQIHSCIRIYKSFNKDLELMQT